MASTFTYKFSSYSQTLLNDANENILTVHADIVGVGLIDTEGVEISNTRLKPKELIYLLEALYSEIDSYFNKKCTSTPSLVNSLISVIDTNGTLYSCDKYLQYYWLNAMNYALTYTEPIIFNFSIRLATKGGTAFNPSFAKNNIFINKNAFIKILDYLAIKEPTEQLNGLKLLYKRLCGSNYPICNEASSLVLNRLTTLESMINNDDGQLASKFEKDKKWAWFQHSQFQFVGDKLIWYRFFNKCITRQTNIENWLKESAEIAQQIDLQIFEQFITTLLFEISKDSFNWFRRGQNEFLIPFLYVCDVLDTEKSINFILKITDLAYVRIPGAGSASSTLGNEGLNVLCKKPTYEKIAMIYGMKTRTKNPYFIDALDRTIAHLKANVEFDEDEIQDKYIENYGFENNVLTIEFGDYQAVLTLKKYNDIQISWLNITDNKMLKSEPSALKKNYSEELKDFKLLVKAVKKTQSTERIRLEKSWLNDRSWDFETWNRCLRQHAIIKELVSGMIWRFEENGQIYTGIPLSLTEIFDFNKNVIDLNNPKVELWHPVHSTAEEIQSWRNFIFEKGITQPIKQAFREIYLVTDAEINTETYSNRFLNHVLEHHKMKALAEQRLWNYRSVYSYEPPSLSIPRFNIFTWFDIQLDSDFVQVDRVHFQTLSGEKRAFRMEQVPVVVFSEVMRDIDLFVTKSTIGIEASWDTRWQHNADYTNYWDAYNKRDELSTNANMRKELLERIVPKLKIASQCTFDGCHLVVQGVMNRYRIHIESGNSFLDDMRYLCIMPSRDNSQNLFLPFEGNDSILSVIISKAFLLANDDKITDSTITSQIHRK